jgi:hypothetical protein
MATVTIPAYIDAEIDSKPQSEWNPQAVLVQTKMLYGKMLIKRFNGRGMLTYRLAAVNGKCIGVRTNGELLPNDTNRFVWGGQPFIIVTDTIPSDPYSKEYLEKEAVLSDAEGIATRKAAYDKREAEIAAYVPTWKCTEKDINGLKCIESFTSTALRNEHEAVCRTRREEQIQKKAQKKIDLEQLRKMRDPHGKLVACRRAFREANPGAPDPKIWRCPHGCTEFFYSIRDEKDHDDTCPMAKKYAAISAAQNADKFAAVDARNAARMDAVLARESAREEQKLKNQTAHLRKEAAAARAKAATNSGLKLFGMKLQD